MVLRSVQMKKLSKLLIPFLVTLLLLFPLALGATGPLTEDNGWIAGAKISSGSSSSSSSSGSSFWNDVKSWAKSNSAPSGPPISLGDALRNTALGVAVMLQGNFQVGLVLLLAHGAIYVVAPFLIIFKLFQYVLSVTLFKDDAHKGMRNGIAIGFGLLGAVSPPVFAVITGWGGTAAWVLVIALIIFVMFGFFNKGHAGNLSTKTDKYNAAAEEHSAHAKALDAQHAADRLEHDLKVDSHLEAREDKLVTDAEEVIDVNLTYANDFASQLRQLRNVLAKIGGVSPERRAATVQSIMSQAAAFTNYIRHNEEHLFKLNAINNDFDSLDHEYIKVEEDEDKTIKYWENYFSKQIKEKHNQHITGTDDEKKQKVLDYFTQHVEPALNTFIRDSREFDAHRTKLVKDIRNIDEHMLKNDYGSMASIRDSLVDNLNASQFPEAVKDVDRAIDTEKNIRAHLTKLRALEADLEKLIEKKEALDNKIEHLIRHVPTTT